MTFVDRLTHRHDDGTETVRWRARYRDPAGRERSKSFDRKSDAEQYLAQVTSDLLRSEWADPDRGRTRLRDWAPRWLATKRKLKPKTRYGYESLLRTRILPELGELPLARLERVTIEEWLSGMVEEGLSTSRTRQAFNVLAAMLDAAVANAMIARNVARGVELPRLATAPRRFLHEEQVARLSDAIDPTYRLLVLVLTYGCLRWSEAVALRRGRCDLLRRRLEILEAAVEVGSDLVWGTPKSHRVRTVSLSAFVCEELAHHLEALPETPDALVLTTKTGLAAQQRLPRPPLEAGTENRRAARRPHTPRAAAHRGSAADRQRCGAEERSGPARPRQYRHHLRPLRAPVRRTPRRGHGPPRPALAGGVYSFTPPRQSPGIRRRDRAAPARGVGASSSEHHMCRPAT